MLSFIVAVLSVISAAVAQQPFVDPTSNGGFMLSLVTVNPVLGEPLNVIISGLSSPGVLTENGIINFAKAIGFSTECLGIHIGDPQAANLGDGNGLLNQTIELRQDYGDPNLGTCLESLIGGNHFRVYQQNGPTANTEAIFLAVSQEEDAEDGHNIVANGYDIGRDSLVANAVGTKSFGGVTYQTVAQNLTGLLPAGSQNINHGIATDGITTLLTVTIQ